MPNKDVMGLVNAANATLDMLEPTILLALSALKRTAFHLAVADHRVPYSSQIAVPILLERTFGNTDQSQWGNYDYIDLARRKCRLCWRTGRSCRDVIKNAPWLLEKGDTKYPGGTIFNGLILAGSGLPWQYDEAYSYSLAHLIWARIQITEQNIMGDDSIIIL